MSLSRAEGLVQGRYGPSTTIFPVLGRHELGALILRQVPGEQGSLSQLDAAL